ncbi:MAG: hypothetical protein QOH99_575 [Frankiaceae bacterium]|jgi:hypothetical protein|nr:hypothetical protein [Frankiaceae bacterium]
MTTAERLCADLDAAMASGGSGLSAADQLCNACVEYLGVDGAAISYVNAGNSSGTFGSSGALSRRLDEYQFTFGEGPCFEALATKAIVLAPDLGAPAESRWPAFSQAVLAHDVHAVFASPVVIAASSVAALDLFRHRPGRLTPEAVAAFGHAASLAAFPLLDLMTASNWSTGVDVANDADWTSLGSLERVEVYQATGMVMDQLNVGPGEALARLRAHAFAANRTASEIAWDVVRRVLTFEENPSGATP